MDECETHQDLAFKVNADGVKNIAVVTKEIDATLIMFQQIMFLMEQKKRHITKMIKQIHNLFMENQKKQEKIML